MDEATMRTAATILRALARVKEQRAEYRARVKRGEERELMAECVADSETRARDAIATFLGAAL